MPSVDNRVVRMEFDNTAFDSKIKSTLVNLQQLDKALKLQGAQKGFVGVQEAASKVNLGHFSTTIEGINAKFLAMGTVAVTALAGITTQVISTGAQMIKSLSVDPILDGYREYETNLNSIQTILANTASKGTTLDQVNAALNDLNTYSDKTIYNFGQMARNIGTFTAAGVGLDQATGAIKGIANLAALSGSNADQASTAMYQLSQAMASGSVKAQDWISVVNAGMGGEVFQKALFDTAKALKTVKNVPIGQTFEEWKKSGGNFKKMMSEGVITSKVLSQTLEAFTGDMTEAQLVAKGYTTEQAKALIKTAKIASDAATQVKTFTQLLGTVKEAVGTGWADTFSIVVGNFEEAKKLWTNVNNVIGKIIGNQAKARNDLLAGWKAFGGRTALLKGLANVWHSLLEIINPIRLALRTIFPRTSVKQLLLLTQSFVNFTKSLMPTKQTIMNLFRVFRGFFAALSIGWTILKEGVKLILRVGKALLGLGGPGLLAFAASIGDVVFAFQQFLVKGKGITNIFTSIGDAVVGVIPIIGEFIAKLFDLVGGMGSFGDAIANPIPFIKDLVSNITDLFSKMGDTGVVDKLGGATGRVGQRVKTLGSIFEKIAAGFSKVFDALSKVGEELRNFFADLGKKIADAFGEGDFNKVLDIINVGLLGGILLMLRKFFKKGLKLDIGGGFLEKIGKIFEQLLGVLKALQTQIKSKAILNIAYAMGILTLSIIALSLVDSVALTKALTAMAVGFGQLMGAFALVQKMDIGAKDIVKFTVLAGALLILSSALFILAGAARMLSSLNWEDLAKGLLGVAALLGALVGATHLINKDLPELIGVAATIIGLAFGINLLALAVRQFASMDPFKLAQGMAAAALAITGLIVALDKMPSDIDQKGFSMLKLSAALFLLGFSVKKFADMDAVALAKGLGTVAGGLYLIGVALNKMPKDTKEKSAGLLMLSVGLLLIAKAMEMIAKLSLGELASSVTTLGIVMAGLIIAMNSMEAGVPGAEALLIIAASLVILAVVLRSFAAIPFGDLVKGLLTMVAVIAVLAGTAAALSASGLILAMEGLGIALLTVGAGFALMGAGAYFAAKAIEVFSKIGKDGARSAIEALGIIATIIPQLVAEIVQGFIDSFIMIADQAPKIAAAAGKLFGSFIEVIIKLVPKIGKLFSTLIIEGLAVIRTYVGEYIKTGIFIILSLLEGIRRAVPQIVTSVGEIIVGFLDAMAIEVPRIIESLLKLWVEILGAMAEGIGRIMATLGPTLATSFFEGFLQGLEEQFGGVWDWFMEMPGRILDLIKGLFGIDSPSTEFISIGIDIILGLLKGLVDTVGKVMTFFIELPGKILGWIGDAASWLLSKGWDILVGLAKGIAQKEIEIMNWFLGLGMRIISWIGDAASWLWDKGWDIIHGLWQGISDMWDIAWAWIKDIPGKIKGFITAPLKFLEQIGKDIIQGLWNGMKSIWEGAQGLFSWFGEQIHSLKTKSEEALSVHSPSRVMMKIGEFVIEGLRLGMQNQWKPTAEWLSNLDITDHVDAKEMRQRFQKIIEDVNATVSQIEDFSPTITPVLDLTKVRAEASKISSLVNTGLPLTPTLSLNQARLISADTNAQKVITPTETVPTPTHVEFNQTINAPEQLSTADIYKQTRNQITMAKEELKIP